MSRLLQILAFLTVSVRILIAAGPADSADTIERLERNLEARQAISAQIDSLREQLKAGPNDNLETSRREQQDRLARLERDFEEAATGRKSGELDSKSGTGFNLATEANDLLKPLVSELKNLTERPRALGQLRTDLDDARSRAAAAQQAVENLRSLIAKLPQDNGTHPGLQKDLARQLDTWNARLLEARSRIANLDHQLNELQNTGQSFWSTLWKGAKSFLLTRGRNLILAVAASVAAFFLLRFLHRVLIRISPVHRGKDRTFTARLLDVIWYALSSIGTIAAGLAVLYATGDWVLLALALISIVGITLAAKHGLPRFYQHARLLLNLGQAREGERVVINGIPWIVGSINFSTRLTNPDMTGTGLFLPLERLGELVSRPWDPHEPWFGCGVNDWVLLNDDTFGKAVALTPEFVQIVMHGGARRTLATQAFIYMQPVNLSHGFRVTSTLALDHRHRADLAAISATLHDALTSGLAPIIPLAQVKSLKVECRGAGDSSLDFEILLDVDGQAASHYRGLQRALGRLAIETATTRSWTLATSRLLLPAVGK